MTSEILCVAEQELEQVVVQKFRSVGTSEESLQAATHAMMHASLAGVDSHGVRLVTHYVRMLEGGRLNKSPNLTVEEKGPASAMVDGDDGLGHYAAYRAMEVACDLAQQTGMAGVGVRRSSHFGAAGAFALAAAERGMIGFATTNTDSIVPLFGGAKPFHGTNPLALAAPVAGGRPWLLDMATSSIPMNRVLLYRSLDAPLPTGVAADAEGNATTDPHKASMVLPLGGEHYGYKGAALASVATLLSSVLTGTTLDFDLIAMVGETDTATPRNLGHFVFAIDPAFFAGREVFATGMMRYLDAIGTAPAREGQTPQSAGEREWREIERRKAEGIPIDMDTARFLGFA